MNKKGKVRGRCMNKRGVFQAIGVFLIFIIFAFVFAIFLGKNDGLQKQLVNSTRHHVTSSTATTMLDNYEDRYSTYWDGVFLFVFVGLWFAGLLVGYYSEDGGPLMIVFFILLVIVLGVAGHFSDYWKEMTDEQDLANRTLYPSMYWIFDNLMYVLLIIVTSGVMVNYFKE